MAVAYDTVGPSAAGTTAATSPLTWTHVNGGNGIVAGVTCRSTGTNNITGVTYGPLGTAADPALALLKYVPSGNGTSGGVALYGLVGATCPTGSNTVRVAFTVADSHNGGSVSVTGGGSFGTPVSNYANAANTVSVDVAGTTAGGLVVSAVCQGSGGAFSATAPNVLRWAKLTSAGTAADNMAGGTDPSAGGTTTVTWTNAASDDWGIVAVEVIPAPAGTPATAGSGAGAALNPSVAVSAVVSGPNYAATAAALSGGYGSWLTPDYAEGGP